MPTLAANSPSAVPVHRAAPLASLLDAFRALSARRPELLGHSLGEIGDREIGGPLLRYTWRGPRGGGDRLKLALFAGIHGDEPAGGWALLDFAASLLAEPSLGEGFEFVLYPCLNPTGLNLGTRFNSAGLDLNREFWRGSKQPEVVLLERELAAESFDGLIALHADDTSDGLYGYARGRLLAEELLRPALHAASEVLPPNHAETIDGFRAELGLIRDCFGGVLAAPPEQRPQPFEIIFETPALAPLDAQRAATVRALHSVVAHYRSFIAYAAGL
ncbi:MAG TPA: succinylglutamate desuccinylase/aspartoacylase family protein [Opitutaceae bacterium]|nr:succinylglutamate desuccinylase/aspartoacylase family protein [Opitutaceae bacterium]